ncbi:histidine--tRNA ligase [Alphaproteobacteria bacterium]|nr:histidine--tRNA ligase [Alphaproteobacteria bacterium]
MKITPVRGTHDFFGQQVLKYRAIQDMISHYSKIYNFEEIITPIFESTDLFKKPLGENSDVVLKEMYTFKDKNEDLLTLRPEYTTPMIRSAISNNLLEKLPTKLYGIGPMFRRERPQKGRYRQFNQINFEILGTHDISSDIELIILANNFLQNLLPEKKINLFINSLGDKDTLSKFNASLSKYFKEKKEKLTQESQNKIISNPIRILDSKDPMDVEITLNAPKISNFYSDEAKEKFSNIQKILKDMSIDFSINTNLVRGLDYYCHTVFEFKTLDLGSQDTLIGGGRYDGLTKLLGGPDIPGVGWAGGIERLIMLMDDIKSLQKTIHLITINESFREYGLNVANQLRRKNINIHFDYKYNLKKSLSYASKLGARYAIIIGEEEVQKNLCTLKDLNRNIQEKKTIENIIKDLS